MYINKRIANNYFAYLAAWMLSEGEFLAILLIPQFLLTLGLKALFAVTDTVAFGAPILFASFAGVVVFFAIALFAKVTNDYLQEKKAREEHNLPGPLPSRSGLSYVSGVFWLVFGVVFFYGMLYCMASIVGTAIAIFTGVSIATLTMIGVPSIIIAATSLFLWLWTSESA